MVPNGWSIKPVADFLEKVSNPVNVTPEIVYHEIGIRSHGKGIFYKEPIFGQELGNKRVFYVEPDCFVVNIVFAWEQAIAKTTADEKGKIASHRFPMFKPRKDLCDIDYILYLFKSRKGKYLLELASPGGAGRNKTLGQSEFSKLELILPPIEEQNKIAKILSTWDKAISITEQLLTNSQQQKKALMQQLLTGKKRLLDIKTRVLFERNFNTLSLRDVCSMQAGKFINASDIFNSHQDGTYPCFGGNGLRGYAKTFTHDGAFSLIGRQGALCGNITFATGRFHATEHAVVVTPRNNINTTWLYYALVDLNLNQYATGQAQPGLSVKNIEQVTIKVPDSINEQQKIAVVLSTADQEITTLQQKLDALKQEKKALMQQLLTGKRRVKIDNKEVA